MTYHDRGTTWFLAQFKPNSHNIAERNLTRQGFRTFLPMQEETKRARGKFITQMRPLFPGYLFVALDMLRGGWRAVNSTYGITRLVSLGKEPTPVPLDLVSQLMLRCDREGKLMPPKLLKPGDVLGAIRAYAYKYFGWPKGLASLAASTGTAFSRIILES